MRGVGKVGRRVGGDCEVYLEMKHGLPARDTSSCFPLGKKGHIR